MAASGLYIYDILGVKRLYSFYTSNTLFATKFPLKASLYMMHC